MGYLCKQIRIYRDFWTASSEVEKFFRDGHREIFASYLPELELASEISFELTESIRLNPHNLGFFVETKAPDTWGFYQYSHSDKLQLGTFNLQPDTNYCDLFVMDIEQFAYWTGPLRQIALSLETYLKSKELLYPLRAMSSQNNIVNIGEGAQVGQLAVGTNITRKSGDIKKDRDRLNYWRE